MHPKLEVRKRRRKVSFRALSSWGALPSKITNFLSSPTEMPSCTEPSAAKWSGSGLIPAAAKTPMAKSSNCTARKPSSDRIWKEGACWSRKSLKTRTMASPWHASPGLQWHTKSLPERSGRSRR